MTDETVTIGFRAEVSGLKKSLKEAESAVKDLRKEVEDPQSVTVDDAGLKKSVEEAKKAAKEAAEGMKKDTAPTDKKPDDFGLKEAEEEAKKAKKAKEELENTQADAAKKNGLKDMFGQVSDKIGTAKEKLGGMVGKAKGLVKPIAAAALAVTGIVVAVKKFYDFSAKTFKMYDPETFDRMAGGLKKEVRKLKTTLGAAFQSVFKGMTSALTGIVRFINSYYELVVKAQAYIRGLLGVSVDVNRTLESSADAMNEASEAADAGLASFDNVATLNFGEMGDMDQAQRISELMKQSAESGGKMRKSISDALAPVKEIHEFFTDLWSGRVWEGFAASAGNAWDTIKAKGGEVLGGIKTSVSSAWDDFKTKISETFSGMGETLGKAWDDLKTGFGTAWDGLKTKIGELGGHISASVLSAAETVKTALGGAWTAVKGKIGELGGHLSSSVHGAVEGIKTTLGGLWTTIKARVSGIGDTLTKSFKGAWDWLAERIGEMPGKFKEAFGRAADGLKSAFSGALNGLRDTAKKLAQDIGDALAGVFNFVKGVYDATIGRVIEGLKEAIRKLDEFLSKLDIVGKAKDLGGKASDTIQGGFNWIKDHIPGLASGGVVEPNSPMLAVVGDNMREREVVSPLSTIRQAVSEALAAQGGNAQGGNIELTVNLDGRTIARGTYDYLKAEAARRGTSGGW